MRTITVSFSASTLFYSTLSLLGERATYQPARLARSLAAVQHSPFLTRAVRHRIRAYNRPGSHPDDALERRRPRGTPKVYLQVYMGSGRSGPTSWLGPRSMPVPRCRERIQVVLRCFW
jgi:hypothetical protein